MNASSLNEVSPERLGAWQRLTRMRRATAPGGDPDSVADGPNNSSAERPSVPAAPEPDAARRRMAQEGRLTRGALRHLSLLDALLARPAVFDPRRTPDAVLWILRLAAYEKIFQSSIPDYAIGAQAVALARQVAGGERPASFVNAALRRLLPTLPATPEALAADPFVASLDPAVRWSVPQEIVKALADGYGDEAFAQILPVLAEREAPVWLRVNTLRATPQAVRDALAAEGIGINAAGGDSPLPEALLWQEGGDGPLPWRSAPWLRGELTAQDLGAMLATELLAPEPGQAVLDACAAPGGKTGHLWQRMGGRGRLVALEVDPARRRVMAEALARLFGGDHGIALPEAPSLASLPGTTAGLPERYDCVLLDVPCLALGLIGRHPEIRWDGRLRHAGAMAAKQVELLRVGAERVAPGGRLLWMTCSPTRLENEDVVARWLATEAQAGRAAHWRLVDPLEKLGAAWRELLWAKDGWARTRPDRMPCDGFAMALWERADAS